MALSRSWDRGPLIGAGYPFDFLPAAAAALSLRRVNSSYIGNCVNIRRSSDNATQDIGFAGNDLNIASFSSFVGGGNGFVTAQYDQSGNGNHAVQAVAANQPQLIPSVPALNNRPGILYTDGSTQELIAPSAGSLDNPFLAGGFVSLVCTFGVTVANRRLFLTGSGAFIILLQGTTLAVRQIAATTNGQWSSISALPLGAHVIDVSYSSASLANVAALTWDGIAQSTGNVQPVGAITTDTGIGIGGDSVSSGWPGHIVETMVFKTTVPSGTQIASLRANQKAYWGTP